MRAFIAFLLVFHCTLGFAQTSCPVVEWQKFFGGTNSKLFNSVALTPDGGYLLAGEYYTRHDGTADIWLTRLDPSGNVVWDTVYGGIGFDAIDQIKPLGDSTFVLIGFIETNRPQSWILRMDADGHILWDAHPSLAGNVKFVEPAGDGGFVLAGEVVRTGYHDYWLARLDASGALLWERNYGGDYGETLTVFMPISSGGFILAGQSTSDISGNKSTPRMGQYNSYDIWVVRVDVNGNKLWDKTYGGTGMDYAEAVVEMPEGTFLIGGSSYSVQDGNKTSPPLGQFGSDVWLLRLDGAGNKLWERAYGGSEYDTLRDMKLLPDGGLIVSGNSSSTNGDKSSPGFGYQDGWILRLDAIGSKEWDITVGRSDTDWLDQILLTPDGGALFAGNSNTNRHWDIWLVKLGPEPVPDSDGDGVADDLDQCQNTPPGSLVDSNGCSIEQLVPCVGPWKNHGEYVRNLHAVASRFLHDGLLTHKQWTEIIRSAEHSSCGKGGD